MEEKLLEELDQLFLGISEKVELDFKNKIKREEQNQSDIKKHSEQRIEYNDSILADYQNIFEILKAREEKLDVKIEGSLSLIKQLDEMIRSRQSLNYKEDFPLINKLIHLINYVTDYKLWLERQKGLNLENNGFADDDNKVRSNFLAKQIAVLSYYLKQNKFFRGNLTDLDMFSAFSLLTGFGNGSLKNEDSKIKQQTIKLTEEEKAELINLLEKVKIKIEKEI